MSGPVCLFLGRGLLLAGNRALRTLSSAGVRLRPLTANRKAAAMAQATVAADIHQALDIALNLAAQIAFDAQLKRINSVAELLFIVFGQFFDARIGADARMRKQLHGGGGADAENILQ